MVSPKSLVIWACLLCLVSSAYADEVIYDQILVKINDGIITQYDLDEKMKPIYAQIGKRDLTSAEKEQLADLKRQTLDQMVNEALLAQEIEKYGITIPDDVIDKEIAKIKAERGMTDEDFAAQVEKDGLNIEEFRDKLKGLLEKQELLSYMVHSKVLVTDTEIQEEYDAKREDYLLEKMIELAIILLPTDIAAQEVKKRIEDKEFTFAEAAEKYSIGPGKEQGGAIGEVNWNDLADDWKEAIEGVSPGGVSTPIMVQGQEALLSPVKIVEDRLVPLEDVRDDIFNRLMEQKREKIFNEYFEKLKQKSVITYVE